MDSTSNKKILWFLGILRVSFITKIYAIFLFISKGEEKEEII